MISYHHKDKDNSLILVKDGNVYYIYYYREKALKKEVPFKAKTSALSFIENFKNKP